MRSGIIVLDVTNLNALKEDETKALIQFFDNTCHAIHRGQIYSFSPSNIESYHFIFHYPMVKKQERTDEKPGKYFILGDILGSGAFGTVSAGGGTLSFTKDQIQFNQALNCDFIYISAAIGFPDLTELFKLSQSKTIYLLIEKSLFYIDKNTYAPLSACDYLTDLNDSQKHFLLQQFAFDEQTNQPQQYNKLTQDEAAFFSSYNHNVSQKNYVIKATGKCTAENVRNEVECMQLTPHLGKIRWYFCQENNVHFIKSNKKASCTLKEIIHNNDLTEIELIQLIDRIFYAVKLQIFQSTLIHRDLKPDNIMVDLETMTVSIIDYGYSKQQGQSSNDEWVGNYLYGAPEQRVAESQRSIPEEKRVQVVTDEFTDGYAVGKILAELCKLKNNHDKNLPREPSLKLEAFASRVVFDEIIFYADPDQVDKPFYKALIPILLKLCARDRKDRIGVSKAREMYRETDIFKPHVLPDFQYIVNEETKKKLLILFPRYNNNPSLFNVSEQWQQNASNNHFSSFSFLYWLIDNNQFCIAKELLKENKLDLDELHRSGVNALFYAVSNHKPQFVDLFLEFGANIDHILVLAKEQLLDIMQHFKIRHHLELLFYLFEIQSDIKMRPIHLAICLGYSDISQSLIDKKANLTVRMNKKISCDILILFLDNILYLNWHIGGMVMNTLSAEDKKQHHHHKQLIKIINWLGKMRANVFEFYPVPEEQKDCMVKLFDFSKACLVENEMPKLSELDDLIQALPVASNQLTSNMKSIIHELNSLRNAIISHPSHRIRQ